MRDGEPVGDLPGIGNVLAGAAGAGLARGDALVALPGGVGW